MHCISAIARLNIDLLYAGLNRLPEPGEELWSRFFEIQFGGGAAATLLHLHRLNVPVKLYTYLGNDLFSSFAEDYLLKSGIEFEAYRFQDRELIPLNISTSMVTKENRSFVSYSSKVTVDVDWLSLAWHELAKASFVLLEKVQGYSGADYKKMKQNHIYSFDIGYESGMRYEDLASYIEIADIFTPNEQEALALSQTSDVTEALYWLDKKTVSNIFLKLGSVGCLIMDQKKARLIPGVPHVKSIDSTGAGDSFLAGVLYGRFNGYSDPEAALFGNIMGANAVTEIGCLKAGITEEILLKRFEQFRYLIR